ncbi:hypothetical protein CVT24_003644 [Panaeolus cyanescens]|uniref:HNH nuclease domain-containing protein n=1 Tax=Panaeolus cyanescens TaxID=181874 RepID=A0A409X3Y3_9AGAR|nr:hypothetical protein CVT24_003644 [Panaeolus cyanescens]
MDTTLVPVSTSTYNRAKLSDPHNQRCLIENCPETQGVEMAHIFDRDTSWRPSVLDSIEWGWKMKKGSLNLDTSRNIIFLGASMHRLYKSRKWALIPEESVVFQYLHPLMKAAHPRKQFPNIQGETFKYRFEPIEDMEDIYLARQSTNDALDITIHEYPFDDFPILTSHVHPKYVILHLGRLLRGGIKSPCRLALLLKYPWLEFVEHLYLRWTGHLPNNPERDRTYIPTSDKNRVISDADSDSVHTPPRRIRPLYPSKGRQISSSSSGDSSTDSTSTSTTESRSIASHGMQSSRTSHRTQNAGVHLLTSRALREQARNDTLENPKWTNSRIASWAKECARCSTMERL